LIEGGQYSGSGGQYSEGYEARGYDQYNTQLTAAGNVQGFYGSPEPYTVHFSDRYDDNAGT